MPRGIKFIKRKSHNPRRAPWWKPKKAVAVPANKYKSRPIDQGKVILDISALFFEPFNGTGSDELDKKLGLQPGIARLAYSGKAIPLMQALRITSHFGVSLSDCLDYDTFWPSSAGRRPRMGKLVRV